MRARRSVLGRVNPVLRSLRKPLPGRSPTSPHTGVARPPVTPPWFLRLRSRALFLGNWSLHGAISTRPSPALSGTATVPLAPGRPRGPPGASALWPLHLIRLARVLLKGACRLLFPVRLSHSFCTRTVTFSSAWCCV